MGLYTHTHTHGCSSKCVKKFLSVQKNEKAREIKNIQYVEDLTNVKKQMKGSKDKYWYSQKAGITLIALVITIIVLIILAGISITMISGQDGILTRAGNASAQDDVSGTKEKIKLELMGKYDTTGKYTNADVITAVKNATGNDVTEKAQTVLSKKGNEVDISDLWVTASTPGGGTSGGDTTITDRTGIQIGDYINYTPDSASAYSSSKLSSSITGSSSNRFDLTQDTLTWQVLRIYDDGAMDLIGTPTNQSVFFSNSLGYNNGVYVMNDICESLYSKKTKGITARSVNLDDMENWLTTDGISARTSYTNSDGIAYDAPKTYTGSYSYRPDIFGKTENESDKYYTTPTTKTYTGGNSSDTLDVKQTYYSIDINSTNYGDGAKVLTASNRYWVASRYVSCYSDFASFGLRFAGNYINGSYVFYSYDGSYSSNYRLRPVVSLGSNIQITPCTGENGTSNMHIINWN